MNVLVWHVHGSYTTAFVQGSHRYLLPVVPDRGPDGRGRAQTWDWPDSAVEVTPEAARYERIDVAILQRPIEVETLAEEWTGRKPGRDLPALYLEHNTPPGAVAEMRHHVAGRDDLTIVHVTNFNALMWDSGGTPTKVIEHGIVDPGYRYWGVLPHGAAVINEPGRRGRVVGADLLADLAEAAPVDLFGIGTADSLSQAQLHHEMARRRFYLHPYRWTSLGLSLLEAMQLGMPVVALNTTEVSIAVPPCAGVVSNRIKDLKEAMTWLISDRNAARDMGVAARASALKRYGLARFLRDWDLALEEAVA